MTAPGHGLIIAAPASGSGKTVLTLGLLRHLAGTGAGVVSAKVGPDYIDPAFHAVATGRACHNLDSWAMRPATLAAAVAELADGGDAVVCEGVMGLFDGARGVAGPADGSTAALARLTGWPVALVVDAGAQAASAAAVVRGFASHDPAVPVAGVLFNRVGSAAHAQILGDACRAALPEIPVLGCLPRADGLELPSRHLGLVQAVEHPDLAGFMDRAAAWVAAHVDTDALAGLFSPTALKGEDAGPPPLAPLGQRIAVAGDAAFAFAYPHVLDGWRRAGAEIAPFSPLAGEAPDTAADAVYLPGGYPELHAGHLAAQAGFMDGLRAAAARGAQVYGECGGYMVLGAALTDVDGEAHRMADLLPLETSFAAPKLHLGYRQVRCAAAGPLGAAGAALRGHEFHYAAIGREAAGTDGVEPLFAAADAAGNDLGPAGLRKANVAGSFVHLIDRLDG